MQVPSNLVVSKIKYPGLYICTAVALWGMVSACTAVVHSFGGLLACRESSDQYGSASKLTVINQALCWALSKLRFSLVPSII